MFGIEEKRFIRIYQDKITMDFLARLKEFREALGLSIHEVGRRTGICATSLCAFERKREQPSLKTLIKLANFYNIDISDSINWKFYHGEISPDLVKKILVRYGFSKSEMAREIGIIPTNIWNTIDGNFNGTLRKLGLVMDVLKREEKSERMRNQMLSKTRRERLVI
ncbi:MAG: helix-turn-helix transcriptional regulator [Synergistaceae bacterium]|nr:helix-turn-helix transcriptional regulator [Synergistaceae bacterium]